MPAAFAAVAGAREEAEVIKLQHSLLKILPRIFVHDQRWIAVSARTIAVELWRDNVRAA